MMTPRKMVATLAQIGNLITYVMAILLPVGFVIVGIHTTGTITALTVQIVAVGGVNVMAVLGIAVVVCYGLGMIGMAFLPYIVLAVTAIPCLVATTGLSELGLHLFIIFYLLMAGITPPICISAFIAAAVAGAHPMKTGWTAMRLAVVLYFIPFFFVFNTALILEGPILVSVYLFALCLVGIWILASGLEGYLLKVGRLNIWARVFLVAGGFLIALPGWITSFSGAALTVLVIAIILMRGRTAVPRLTGEITT